MPALSGSVSRMDANDLQERVGQRIAALRKKAKLPQEQLAERAGLSVGYLSRIERGQVGSDGPSLRVLAEIADVLGVDPGDLFRARARKNPPPAPVPSQSKAAKLLAALPDDDMPLVEEMLRAIQRYRRRTL